MEYLREDVAEKEEETARIRTIVVEESSEKTETESETQDVELSQPVEGWTEQERKASWVDWIKTIGKIDNVVLIFYHLTIGWNVTLQPCLNTFYQLIFQRRRCCLLLFSSVQ